MHTVFFLLGPNYTMNKPCCPEMPLRLMNPMHQPATMVKNHGILPRGVEGQAKKPFSAAPSLGCANLGPMKALGTSQLVPIRSQEPLRPLSSR